MEERRFAPSTKRMIADWRKKARGMNGSILTLTKNLIGKTGQVILAAIPMSELLGQYVEAGGVRFKFSLASS
jgi:hypothetical protein